MPLNPESSGGDDLVVLELLVLDVDVSGRPNSTIDTAGAAASGALGLGIRIGDVGGVDGDEGVGVAPTQAAEDVAGLDLDVALYLGLVLYLGAAQHHNSLARHQEAVTEPCSGCLRAVKPTKSARGRRRQSGDG